MGLLASVKTTGDNLPNRAILHAVEGWGKTTFGAGAPAPLFLQAKGETGLETLIDSGRLAPTPHLPECKTWPAVMETIAAVRKETHEYKTLVIDTLNGLAALCAEHVVNTQFGGNVGEFENFGRGYGPTAAAWRAMLAELDAVRTSRRMAIIGLTHTEVKPFANPEGEDFDRFTPEIHKRLWSLTHKWADMVLFGNYYTTTEKKKTGQKQIGAGGVQRVLYTERRPAFDAKNRHGLPPVITVADTPTEAFGSFLTALTEGRKNG